MRHLVILLVHLITTYDNYASPNGLVSYGTSVPDWVIPGSRKLSCERHSNPARLIRRPSRPEARDSERFHWGGREIPNLSILYASDVLLRPRRAAAPRGPPTTQLLSRSARRISSRSACSNALPPMKPGSFRISANGTRSEGPVDSRAARSIRFCSSRMLPGQL